MDTEETFEYELIDISFGYELPEEEGVFAHEKEPIDKSTSTIEYDADGIPMGTSIDEIRQRERMIKEFLEKWGNEHPERRVFNEKLEDYIHVKGISVIEAKEHSAKSYNSTRAVLNIEEVMSNALPVGRVQTKKNDSNQNMFLYMLVMVYRNEKLGTVKLTVGVRRSNNERIEYGITALQPGEPLIKKKTTKTKKKRNPHK